MVSAIMSKSVTTYVSTSDKPGVAMTKATSSTSMAANMFTSDESKAMASATLSTSVTTKCDNKC